MTIAHRTQEDANFVSAPITDKDRAGDAATVSQLKLLVQGVAKRNKSFAHVGATQDTVRTMKHAAEAPWIERARENLSPSEVRCSMS